MSSITPLLYICKGYVQNIELNLKCSTFSVSVNFGISKNSLLTIFKTETWPWRHSTSALTSFSSDKSFGRSWGFKLLHTSPVAPIPVLMVYPAENPAFQWGVVALAEFLQQHGGCSVAVDMWQQGKIAELGPMRWLAEQATAADRVLIVCPQEGMVSFFPTFVSFCLGRSDFGDNLFYFVYIILSGTTVSTLLCHPGHYNV